MPPIKSRQDNELLVRIKTLMVLRVIFLIGFIGLIITFERNAVHATPILPLSVVLCFACFFALSYAIFLRIKVPLHYIASMQVLGDLIVVGGLIFTTGGVESPLSFLFFLVIIETSVMLPRSAIYKAAAGASLIYGFLVDLEFFDLITPTYFFPKPSISYEGAYLFYTVTMNLASYFAVAYLSSILTHRLRIINEELEEKSQHLEKLEVFHHRIVQQMGNGLITSDSQGRITSANAPFQKMSGYTFEEVEGKICSEVLDLNSLREFFLNVDEYTLPHQIEEECRDRNGEPLRVSIKISGLSQPESGQQGFICVFEDLTEIRKMEEKVLQNEQLAAVGRFSAGLAHEIRNPLASLSGSIQFLKEGLPPEDANQRLMEIVLKETERLNEIVTGFLNFSLPRKKNLRVVDLTQLLENVVILMKNSNEYHSSIEIVLSTPEERILIESDEDQLKQMVWNLAINGIQAMDKEGILALKLSKTKGYEHPMFSTSRKGVILSIEDQGRGIPANEINQIFDPFHTTREEGVGLGLATVKKIIEQLGGRIGLTSQPGVGTSFKVFLPLERSLINRAGSQKERRKIAS